MRRITMLILVALMGGTAVYGGVESSVDAIAAESSGGGAIGFEDAIAMQSPSASLRLSHVTAETGVVVTLNASGSTGSSIVLYEWDLDGDGFYDATSKVPTFAHVFGDDGIYGVRVRITDDRGAMGESGIVEVVVLNRAPLAGFTVASNSRNDAATYEFHDDSIDLDGEIVRWSWGFGDGALSDEPNPIHVYADDGTYCVTLVVIDEDGDESAPAVRTIAVGNAVPVAAFKLGAASMVVGESVSFVDVSVDPSPGGSIVHVAWDFGDGSYQVGGPSADSVYVHTYTAAGTYTVTLYVIDDDGDMSSVRKIISVA